MKHSMIAELILSDAFELFGQPKWTFGKNTCNTYEVFAEKVLLPDGEKIPVWPVLELIENDKGLSLIYSRWFLKKAVASAVEIGKATDSHVTLSLNLLPSYAAEETFVKEVLDVLEANGLPAGKLQFELSEAQNLSAAGVENLNILHDEYGVSLYLANFGKGHSNIDLLTEVHFDGIELDRSFAAMIPENEQACRVVVGIQHLAHTLDLKVCAKGIENQDQFEFFEELDCFKGQGYLIGKPMPMEELSDYIGKFAVHVGHE